MKWYSKSPEETHTLGKQLLNEFPDATVICLRGPLGSGKTCFVKGIGERLGIPSLQIKSPTFTTLFEHVGEKTLLHLDFYRHEGPQQMAIEWWEEILTRKDAIVVAEWAERIEPYLPSKRLDLEFTIEGEKERTLHIRNLNPVP